VPDGEQDSAAFKQRQEDDTPALVSATQGTGIDALLERIDQTLSEHNIEMTVTVAPDDGKLIHWLHEHAQILDQHTNDAGETICRINLPPAQHGRLMARIKATKERE